MALEGLEGVVEAALEGLEDILGSSSTIISISDSWNRDYNKEVKQSVKSKRMHVKTSI